MSNCGKNISDTLGYALCANLLFLPHFDVICDRLLNKRTATWNLFVKWKHEWKFGRTRNAVGTRGTGECFHSFFEFSQTFTSVSIARSKHGVHEEKKENNVLTFDYQNVNSLCSRHHYVHSAR